MIRVRALITAEIPSRGYREFPSTAIEAFAIDTAMDTDADAFSIDLGAPTPDLKFLTNRDNEVRATIFTSGADKPAQIEHLHSGIADVVSYSSDNHVISIAGRDISSVATDSQAPPGEWGHVRPKQFITKEARSLGVPRFKLADVSKLTKFYRDGSETYWEAWYRMYRKKKMWMWTEPDGTLVADKLHYSVSPTYFFGKPRSGQSSRHWIPVERVQITKDTQKRVGQVWIYGERGDVGFVAKASDNSIKKWIKRPLKIVTSASARSKQEATQDAWEEIFEGKVGAVEIVITIPLSEIGHIVRQNNMAEVNIPDMGLHGIFFVVGANLRGSTQGYVQEVRLREKNYAISRRVPDDPELATDPADDVISGDIGATLRQGGVRWANSFASAAQEFHDGWPYDLFLGVLLSICHHESSFKNVNEGQSDIEWFPKPLAGVDRLPDGHSVAVTADRWRSMFANDPGTPGNPYGRDRGVGPMQLTTHGYKVWADEFGGKHDEFEGGRWMPQSNIRAGARAFASKLAGLDPKQASLIWEGVKRYNGSGAAAENYRDEVKSIYKKNYEGLTSGIADTANTVTAGQHTNVTVTDATGQPFQVQVPTNAPDKIKKFINYLIRQIGKPYEWGAEGPSSFDCSGLVWAGCHAANIAIRARTTYTMWADSAWPRVQKDDLASGDLVFFSRGGDIHHMGVYLNDGHFIQAPSTGDVVKISPLNSTYYRNEYHGAKRIVPWQPSRLGDYPH